MAPVSVVSRNTRRSLHSEETDDYLDEMPEETGNGISIVFWVVLGWATSMGFAVAVTALSTWAIMHE